MLDVWTNLFGTTDQGSPDPRDPRNPNPKK